MHFVVALCLLLPFFSSCATLHTQSNQELLHALREDPYEYAFDKPGRMLMARGSRATPELLADFEDADNYYLCCLANILARIPSPERDSAFIRKLQTGRNKLDEHLLRAYGSTMMLALTRNRCQGAVPIISEYANDPAVENDLRTQAKIALNLLGQGGEQLDVRKRYEIAENLVPLMEQEWARQALRLLEALIRHDVIADSGKIAVTSATRGKGNGSALEGLLPEARGTWDVEFLSCHADRIPFTYHWRTGPLAGAKYHGLLERQSGIWRVTRFQEFWRS